METILVDYQIRWTLLILVSRYIEKVTLALATINFHFQSHDLLMTNQSVSRSFIWWILLNDENFRLIIIMCVRWKKFFFFFKSNCVQLFDYGCYIKKLLKTPSDSSRLWRKMKNVSIAIKSYTSITRKMIAKEWAMIFISELLVCLYRFYGMKVQNCMPFLSFVLCVYR